MLVRVVKEFDLKSNGVSLVGSNPAVSDYFITPTRQVVTFIPGIFPSFINLQSLHFRHDLSQPTKVYGVFQPLMSIETPISQHNNVGRKEKYNNNIFYLTMGSVRKTRNSLLQGN